MILDRPFAVNGDKEDFSEATDPEGKISLENGWTALYALSTAEGGLLIDRKKFNQLFYLLSSEILALKSGAVLLSTNQTVNGVKTFTSEIVGNISTATKLQTARTINGVNFDGTANITVSDATAVKLTGNQTIAGIKTFSSSPIVPTPTTGTQAVNKNYVDNSAIGVGQTWQNVKASRSAGVTYTNTTGKAICISVGAVSSGEHKITVDGVTVMQSWSGVTAIIPNGSTYVVSLPATLLIWTELR